MTTRFKLVLLSIFVVCLSASAAGGCWSYWDLTGLCSGEGGCQGTYPRTRCWWGCVEGRCNNCANYTECCGQVYCYAQIYPTGTCQPSQCGLGPSAENRNEDRQANTPPADTKQDVQLAYRPARILFVPSSCTHEYGVFFEGGLPSLAKGAM